MLHIDLFSGIGGFALAAEAVWPGIEHIFCDNDPFSQAVLKKHWPTSKIYGDIRTLTNTKSEQTHSAEQVGLHSKSCFQDSRAFILTGGFPCQPFSQAGRRKGTDDDRYLWPEMFRVISEFHPRWVIAENVSGLVTWNEGLVLETACSDLEGEGYEVQPFIIPACALGAPHRRDRVWIIANCTGERRVDRTNHRQERHVLPDKDRSPAENKPERSGWERWTLKTDSLAQDSLSQRSGGGMEDSGQVLGSGRSEAEDAGPGWESNWPEVATRFCALDDGLPNGLARPRGWRNAALKGAGNAIVPQVAEQIMLAIKKIESL